MGMRIALVSREFPPGHGGGIGSYAARIAPALANAGARVHIITRRLAADETEIEPIPGVTIHRVNMGDRSGESCLRASIVTAQKLLDLIRTDGLDAIEFAEYEAMASAWLALRSLDQAAARIPVAVHLHSPTELNAQLNGHDPQSLDRAMQDLIAAERRTIALADGVCAPGSFMADWAHERFAMPERATVIPYAADLGDPPAPNPDARTLLYVGRLEQRKGVDTLIRAWNRVAPDHSGWSLRLVGADTNTAPGGGSCRTWLESMLDQALLDRTDFAGPMNAAQLREVRARTALAVIPSRWENFPNTCIEAMAA
ncbi:MAG: glycosyltransferase family 4 protein, partial [Phycisphaerales bacterium JB065]